MKPVQVFIRTPSIYFEACSTILRDRVAGTLGTGRAAEPVVADLPEGD
ncbi:MULTISPECIES: hypothetical protein [unclassified Variovorax]|nr:MULTISPECIES: hypothetical protein [unclassified Variovorax]